MYSSNHPAKEEAFAASSTPHGERYAPVKAQDVVFAAATLRASPWGTQK